MDFVWRPVRLHKNKHLNYPCKRSFILQSCQAGTHIVSLAWLLQLWYFLPFVGSAVKADELLIGSIGRIILFIAIVVERVLLLVRFFADIFLIFIIGVWVILSGSWCAELLVLANRCATSAITWKHAWHVLDELYGFATIFWGLVFHFTRVRNGEE